MLGERKVDQSSLFFEFSLERHVPASHLLCAIDRFVDLGEVRAHLAPFYSPMGRPSIDPELLIRMLLVGYCLGIRSERRLCEEVHLNLAYRWFCRLGLDGDVPDHSTFSKNRHGRFRDSDLLRVLFEETVWRCIKEGLVGGEGFAVDASIITADAHRQRGLARVEDLDQDKASRAVREYMEVLDEAAFGGTSDAAPKFVSPVDPAARWTAAGSGPAVYAYCTNYLIDLDCGVIVDVEPSTAIRQGEVQAAKTMIERTAQTFDLEPERLAADTGYGSAETLAWIDARGIATHIPVFDKSTRHDGTFSRVDFSYNPDADTYTCPAGKSLQRYRRRFKTARNRPPKDDTLRYRAGKADCQACPLKSACCPKAPARKVTRSIHEAARDKARAIAKTDAYVASRRQRKKVEMLFAHLKRILKLDRLRLRGPNGAKDEFLLAATAQNFRKLAKLIPSPALAPA
jgi:transposase